ncbi:hypothetical protein [Listeria ilorinensis]|uniref:hypothetical protein n=1 Tax=Listeria ilorinensis TaxID=2867439 RepID=UPI001EF3E77D|nr:hypothetical protein [Listeria ilorinensis]
MKKETSFLKVVIILIGLFILTIIGPGFPVVGYRAFYPPGGFFRQITTVILTNFTLSALNN